MGPHPAVAETRRCVRHGLDDLTPGDLVLTACSGGADSLALAAALAHEAPRLGLRAGGVTIDHGLQAGSARQAAAVAATLAGLGLDPVCSVAVAVAGHGGPEAAARAARYDALDEAARSTGAVAVLLGHTRDDQAETVLLGLARGSGARSLAGMAARRGHYRRPLLGVGRATLRDACQALRTPLLRASRATVCGRTLHNPISTGLSTITTFSAAWNPAAIAAPPNAARHQG